MKKYTISLPPDYIKTVFPMGKALCAELRKPETKQIKEQLKTDEGECCLGVLCRLQGRLVKRPEGFADVSDLYYLSAFNPLYSLLSYNGSFPELVQVNDDCHYFDLVELNDADFTFPQIADIIEIIWDCQ